MIRWKDIEVDDKGIIDSYYKRYNSEVSDYSFTQLLLWGEAYNIQYAEVEGFLVVKLQAPQETVPYIHMPVGSGNLGNVVEKVRLDFENRNEIITIRSITRSQFLELKRCVPHHMRFKLLRDQYEYVYPSHDLSKLNTKKLRRKRDMYKSFSDKNNFKISVLTNCGGEVISELLKTWYANLPKSKVLSAERLGIEKVLRNWDSLDTVGCVLEVDGSPVAFSFGEPLTDNMFLVLVEKAIRDYKGAYVAVIKEFALMYEGQYKFTNREEDLGIPGLRKSKLLFRPCRFIEKGVAYFSSTTTPENNDEMAKKDRKEFRRREQS